MESESAPATTSQGIELEAKAILFDLDGTLIDSTQATERSWNKWAEALGIDGYRHNGHGLPARDIVARHVAPDRRQEALRLAERLEEQETEGIAVKEGARRLLRSIPSGRWGIVTSCTADLARVRMDAAGLAAPAVMITADDVVHGKPSPEGYQAAARSLGFDPIACLVVEDTAAGLEAGRSAGCRTVGVAGTLAAPELDADYVIESMTLVSIRPTETAVVVHLAAPQQPR
ncbi:phosphatase [Sinomonas cellulolyticus]|uniref:HAD-IA family hydrolase n=1 Tax=Sinomonas cellulolyticus TaxID=2801916 RepID=A0ABS1K5I2_9MICC|nr:MULTISPECIES: HAD-IA family hydrolase [Sinomonas]MBL0706939.1 HAD-IA family hydrolase [Sinomonas cellulolyticus]GHG59850.1 phosphatase [Sinomonas sp. KCTC 49339]